MTKGAQVRSLDAIRAVRAALIEFAENAGAAIAAADSDLARTGTWLFQERPAYWKREVRRQEELVQKARQEITKKQLIRAPEPASVVLERRELDRAKARHDRARERADATRAWCGRWERESLLARGPLASLAEFIHADIPRAVVRLDRMLDSLEAYLAMPAPEASADQPPAAAPEGERRERAGTARSEGVGTDEVFALLRARTRDLDERARTAREAPDLAAWPVGPLTPEDARTLAKLDATGSAPEPDELVVIAENALQDASAWFIREAPGAGGRSGWFVGPLTQVDRPGASWLVPYREVVGARPDLAAIFALKVGTVAVVAGQTVAGVLDHRNHNVWLANH